MSLRVAFDLEDKDLKFFRDLMKKSQSASKGIPEAEIIAMSVTAVEQTRAAGVPAFVRQRLDQVKCLIDMLADKDWNLQDKDRQHVWSALSYFANPEDLIADSIPVLGYIDDAIMIELVLQELEPEINAFKDFMAYRKDLRHRDRNDKVSRAEYLEAKRQALQSEMRRLARERMMKIAPHSRKPFRLL